MSGGGTPIGVLQSKCCRGRGSQVKLPLAQGCGWQALLPHWGSPITLNRQESWLRLQPFPVFPASGSSGKHRSGGTAPNTSVSGRAHGGRWGRLGRASQPEPAFPSSFRVIREPSQEGRARARRAVQQARREVLPGGRVAQLSSTELRWGSSSSCSQPGALPQPSGGGAPWLKRLKTTGLNYKLLSTQSFLFCFYMASSPMESWRHLGPRSTTKTQQELAPALTLTKDVHAAQPYFFLLPFSLHVFIRKGTLGSNAAWNASIVVTRDAQDY